MTHQAAAQTRLPATPEEYALFYAWMGWPVLAVANRGKAPLTKHGVKDATTDPAVIRHWWKQWPDANIGIAMGQVAGVWCLDIDPRNGGDASLDALIDRLGLLPDTIEALTGGGGRHIIFRYPDGTRIPKRKLADGIDLISDGGYILVEPSIHPSGTAYTWEASSSPVDGKIAIEAPATLLALVCAAPEAATLPMPDAVPLEPVKVREIRSALAFVPADDRDCWLKVGMALHATRAGNAYGLWVEWSQQSEKFNARDQGRVWRSFKPHEGITLSTLFALAKQHGWQDLESETKDQILAANKRVHYTIADAPKPLDVTPFPIDSLNAACHWMESGAAISHPLATQQGAIALATLAASRLYQTAQGGPVSAYLGVLSTSVGHTRYVRAALHQALSEAGLRRLIRGTRFNSPQAIYSTLMRSPACLYATDEFGQMLAFARRQPSGLLEQALSILAEAHGGRDIFLDSAQEAGFKPSDDDKPVIRAPSLNLLALLPRDQMATLARRTELGRGAIEQMLYVFADDDALVERTPMAQDAPAWLSQHLRAVRQLPEGNQDLDLTSLFNGNAELIPNARRVPLKADPKDFEARIRAAVGNGRELMPLASGAVENFHRICAALAVWEDPQQPAVSLRILEWTAQYVAQSVSAFVERYSLAASDDGRLDAYQKALEAIVEAGPKGLSRRELAQFCWAYRTLSANKRDEMLTTLLDDGQAVETKTESGRGKRLIAAKFIRQEA